jgi:hypothetical protein
MLKDFDLAFGRRGVVMSDVEPRSQSHFKMKTKQVSVPLSDGCREIRLVHVEVRRHKGEA